jgi:TatD DNase family protein
VTWFDSHCHIQDDPGAVARARAEGTDRMVVVGTDRAQSLAAIELASKEDGVWATVGLHPHEAKEGVDTVADLLDRPRVVAVGECGLDYHYDHSPRPIQRDAFAAQIRLAFQHDLALVIHTREAWDDTFAILTAEGVPERTVFHCFSGGPAEAERCLGLGTHLSFSGVVTFKNAEDVRGAAALCPLDRLLVETDSPYLTPVPHRGRRNEPGLVRLVGAGVARAKGVAVEVVETASSANAGRVFRIDRVP